MSVEPKHLILIGLGDVAPSGLPPHKMTVLPSGLRSLATGFDVFDADLVVFGPSPLLFAPPGDLNDAGDLVVHITHDDMVPPTLVDPGLFSPRDASLAEADFVGASRPHSPCKSKPRPQKPSSIAPAALPQDVMDPIEILRTLVACGTSMLRRSYSKGRAGPQDFIVFVPPRPADVPNTDGPYEPHCTGALMENWLGLKHHDNPTGQGEAEPRVRWTPEAEALGWPSFMNLGDLLSMRRRGTSPFMNVVPSLRLLKRGASISDDEFATEGGDEPGPWRSLIAAPDGTHAIAGFFEIGAARIHVLPAPQDVVRVVTRFVEARYGLEPSNSELPAPKPPKPQIAIRLSPCEPVATLSAVRGALGDKRGTGWWLQLNDQHAVGVGETKFLQLLAFIAADRAGQTDGIDPTKPRIRGKPVKNVFRPSDGCRGTFARGTVRKGASDHTPPSTPNPALAASEINELFTTVCRELGIVEGDAKIRIVTNVPGKKGRYGLSSEFREAIKVVLSDERVPHPDVRHVLDLVDRSRWKPKKPLPSVASRLWYASCPEQVEPCVCV